MRGMRGRGMQGYPSAEQVAAANMVAATDAMMFDPLWMFATGQPQMGSWLSDLTGVHISSKGVSLEAPKLPSAWTGNKKIEPKAPSVPVVVNVGTTPAIATGTTPGMVPNTGAPIATNVPVYTPITSGSTPASALPGAVPTVATLPDGTQIPVIQSGMTQTTSGLSAPGPLGLPMYAWLAAGAGAFLLLSNRK